MEKRFRYIHVPTILHLCTDILLSCVTLFNTGHCGHCGGGKYQKFRNKPKVFGLKVLADFLCSIYNVSENTKL